MTPEIQTGYRAPSREGRTRAGQVFQGPDRIPEGYTVIKFKARRYQVQLTAPMPRQLPDGRLITDKALKVVADEGFAFLHNEKDKEKIELLREHPSYGNDFVDFSEELAQRQKAKEEEALAVLANPEARKRIIEALKAQGESFELPKTKEPEKKGGSETGAGAGGSK